MKKLVVFLVLAVFLFIAGVAQADGGLSPTRLEHEPIHRTLESYNPEKPGETPGQCERACPEGQLNPDTCTCNEAQMADSTSLFFVDDFPFFPIHDLDDVGLKFPLTPRKGVLPQRIGF